MIDTHELVVPRSIPITQEIQAGYRLGSRLLRPTYVGVSKKKTQNIEEKEEKKGSK
jgi:hypothetical protein